MPPRSVPRCGIVEDVLDEARQDQLIDALMSNTVTAGMDQDLAKFARMDPADRSEHANRLFVYAFARQLRRQIGTTDADRARARRRRQRQAASADGTWPHWSTLVAEDGPACALCGADVLPDSSTWEWRPTVDHVIPLADGGTPTRDNAQLAHQWCNNRKGRWL